MFTRILFSIFLCILIINVNLIAQGETCDDAIDIPYSTSWCDIYNNEGYSQDNDQVNFNPSGLNCLIPERDIWFKFKTGTNLFETVLTITGTNDGAITPMNMPRITIVRGICQVLEAMICEDAALGSNSVSITIPQSSLFIDTDYYIIISDWSDTGQANDGGFELCMEEYIPPIEFNIADGEIYTTCNGTLYDTGGPTGNYSTFESINAQICPTEPFQCITIDVISHDFEPLFDLLTISPVSGTCNQNYVGDTFTGTASNPNGAPVTSMVFDECVNINFESAFLPPQAGFQLNWSCSTTPCPGGGGGPTTYIPAQPQGAWEISGCDSGAGSESAVFYPDTPPGDATFDINSTCWSGVGEEAFFYFWFEAQETGVFEFIVANPPNAPNQDIDVDYLVWGPVSSSTPNDFCVATLSSPIRCSYAEGGPDALTGLANINPETGGTVNDTSEGATGDGFTRGIDVQEGEVYLILLNYYSGDDLAEGVNLDFSGSTPGLFETDEGSPLSSNISSTSICSGESVDLEVSGANISIAWSPATGLTCTDCPNPTASPLTTTTYTVIGEGICGLDTIDILVEVFDLSNIPDESICEGGEVQLVASSNSNNAIWTWTPATGLSCTDCPNPIASPMITTTYTVTMESAGCTLTDDVTVTVQSGQAANYVIIDDTAICLGSSIPLGGAADPDATYTWSPSGDLDLTDPANPIASPTTTTTYTLEVTNTISGCSSTDQVTIEVISSFSPTIMGSLEVCTSTMLSTEEYDSYMWMPNGEMTQSITVSTAGDYTVIVTDANGCTGSNTVTVNAGNSPIPVVTNTEDVICSDIPNGSISIEVTGGSTPYSYVWTNNISQDENAFNLTAGTYTVTVTDAGGCTGTTSATIEQIPLIEVSVDKDTICPGELIQLSAIGGIGAYTWTPEAGLDLTDIANPTANPTMTTTYTASYQSVTENLVINGDFELGNTGFLSTYTLGDGGQWGDLSEEGEYGIYTSPSLGHNNFVSCGDHTSGSGNMMVVNGANLAGQDVWCQTVNVDPNTDYNFSAWFTSVVSDSPAQLQFSINGNLLGNTVNLTPTTCSWQQFNANWSSGTQTSVQICLVNLNTATGGNDFAIDDIEFGPVCSLSDTVTVYVSQPEIAISDVNDDFCGSCQGSIETTVDGGFGPYTYTWNDSQNQATATASNLCGDAVYSVIVTDQYGCSSSTNQILQDLGTIPVEIEGNPFICPNGNTVLTAGPVSFDSYEWSNGIFTPNNTIDSPGTYEVTVTSGTCSGTTSVTVSPGEIPNTTIMGPSTGCEGGIIIVDAGEGFTSYTWSGGLGNGQTANIQSSGTYTVTISNEAGCTNTADYTIQLGTLPLEITGDDQLCLGESTTLSANTQGAVFWYENGIQINNTASATLDITPTMTGTISYVAEAVNNSCTVYDTITVTVGETPIIDSFSGDEICQGEMATISASSNNGNILWTPQGSFTDPSEDTQMISPNSTTTYLVTADNNGCTVEQEVTVVVTPGPEYNVIPNTSICLGSSIAIGTINEVGTTYTWSSDNGTINDPNIGNPEVSPSTTTTYTLVAENGDCQVTETVTITVIDASLIVEDIEACPGDTVSLTAVGSGNGTYSWYDWEGNPLSNEAILPVSPSTTTSYTINYEENGCIISDIATVNVDEAPAITLTANPGIEVVAGTSVDLTATGIPAGSTFQWTSPSGEGLGNGETITISPSQTSTYTLSGTTAEGCPFIVDIVIFVSFLELEFPNVFTPNNDDINDTFSPVYDSASTELVEFRIFDRWGEVVHEDPNNAWDGTFGGKNLPSDIYLWYVKTRNANGEEQTYKGDVALLR